VRCCRSNVAMAVLEQGFAPGGFDGEGEGAGGEADLLRFEVDRERLAGLRRRVEKGHVVIRQHDRKHAVVEAVRLEYFVEPGRDQHADAEVGERPRRLLAARSAAEIVVSDEKGAPERGPQPLGRQRGPQRRPGHARANPYEGVGLVDLNHVERAGVDQDMILAGQEVAVGVRRAATARHHRDTLLDAYLDRRAQHLD